MGGSLAAAAIMAGAKKNNNQLKTAVATVTEMAYVTTRDTQPILNKVHGGGGAVAMAVQRWRRWRWQQQCGGGGQLGG